MSSPDIPLVAVTGALPLGGSSTFLVNLARAFRARGLVLPIVVLSEDNAYAREFAALETPVTLIPHRSNIYEDRLRLAYEAVVSWRPRAVLACLGGESFEVLRSVPPGVARLGIIQSHDPGPHEAVRLYAEWIDTVVGVSQTICEHVRMAPCVGPRRVEKISYGIAFGPAVERPATRAEEPLRIIYLGRLIEEQKRVSRLAELIHMLSARGVNFHFTFAGRGPQQPALQAALAGRAAVTFLGEVPTGSVPALLAAQDVLVLLSDYEGLPLSLLEAMGAGVVPVVSDLESGIRDVVTEQTGVRVPVGDVSAAVGALVGLAQDRVRLAALSAAAAQSVRTEYSAARMAENYLQVIGLRPPTPVLWPSEVRVPAPLGIEHPWLYQGLPRVARRWTKRVRDRLIAGRRGSSNQS